MTPKEFRKLALSFPHTEERQHMRHPDFRVAGKIFATMGYPNKEHAMVKITPVEQEMLVEAEPAVFSPVTGAWGRQGCTSVMLKAAKRDSMRRALRAAWELNAPKEVRGANGVSQIFEGAKKKSPARKRRGSAR
jgi:hypothetical protein